MIEVLQAAGLTKGEARVYLACLDIGAASVGKIVNHSGVTKSIIYQILQKLNEKGLISTVVRGKTKYFQAAPAHNLLDYLDARETELLDTKDRLRHIIPEIELRRSSASKSAVTLYDGFKGIMTAYTKRFVVLSKGDEYYNFGLPAQQPAFHHAFWQKDHRERAKRGIVAKLLYNPSVSDDVLKTRNAFAHCDARRMPLDVETPSWVLVYSNVVVIAIPQGPHPIAIEIESAAVAKSFAEYFRWLWEQSVSED